MRIVLNYLGLFLVAIALMLLGADMVTSLEHQGQITVRSFQDVWAMFDHASVAAANAWMTTHLPGFLAGAVQSVLHIPAWSIGVVGVVITFVAGHKHEAA